MTYRSVTYAAMTCILLWSQVAGAPTHNEVVNYLQKYGFVSFGDPNNAEIQGQESLVEAVRHFQQFAGLDTTGELDRETLDKMSQKRCGNVDIEGTGRAKRYTLHGSKWPKQRLTYKITKYTRDLKSRDTDAEIAAAFRWWSDKSSLSFRRVSATSRADIEIKFVSGDHGDGDPFDGRGQTLAHAYFPNSGGNAHFDEDETWLLRPSRNGVGLRIVAAHEFGHSLGLSHSDAKSALMAPFYNPTSKGLEDDDIRAIQRLYGKNYEKPFAFTTTTTSVPRFPSRRPPSRRPPTRRPPTRRPITTRKTTTTTSSTPVGAICNGKFGAVAQLWNGSTYAFQGKQFWRLSDSGADKGYPQTIKQVWGIDGEVDAALSFKHYLDLFQGRFVHRYVGGRKMSTVRISQLYRGVPTSGIDAAFQWSGNGKIYFIKGTQYWRYNFLTLKVDPNYPRPLSVWRGLPNHIDAALQWKGYTYFFSKGLYYRLDDETINVAQLQQQPYPRRSDKWWLGCSNNNLRLDPESNQLVEIEKDNGENSSSRTAELTSATLLLSLSILGIIKAALL